MKNILLIALALFALTAFGQDKKKKVQEFVIQTSAECNTCKELLEEEFNYTKGVKFADLDVPSKKMTIRFKIKHISLDEIKKIISNLGYDADDIKADKKAYAALPQCCKVGGMEHLE